MKCISLAMLCGLSGTQLAYSQCEVQELVATLPDSMMGRGAALQGDVAAIGGATSVHVFERAGLVWSEVIELASPLPNPQSFGRRLAIDGDWIAVGSPGAGPNGGPFDQGRVFLFERQAGSWVASQHFGASASYENLRFGESLDMDGDRLIVGVGADAGVERAYVFENSGGTWMEMAVLEGPADDAQFLASDVQVSGDKALLSTRGDGVLRGAGWLFEFSQGEWSSASKLSVPGTTLDSDFVHASALDGDEAILTSLQQGAWLFDLSGGQNSNYCMGGLNSQGTAAAITFEGSVSILQNEFELVATGLIQHKPGLFFFGTAATQQALGNGYLCATGSVQRLSPAQLADGSASARRWLDFTGAAGGSIQPGGTAYFQYWYRDPAAGGAAFNLSDGLALVFCP